jgi:hypothetical protein
VHGSGGISPDLPAVLGEGHRGLHLDAQNGRGRPGAIGAYCNRSSGALTGREATIGEPTGEPNGEPPNSHGEMMIFR